VFIGQAMSGIELRIMGIVKVWDGLGTTVTGITRLDNPVIPSPVHDLLAMQGVAMPPLEGNRLGIYLGWGLSLFVHLALAHATFFYRWPETEPRRRT
jgi:hypothetical protein